MTNDQHPIPGAGPPGAAPSPPLSPATPPPQPPAHPGGGAPPRPRVIWLHTQPEHYFNRMMDDLAAGAGYAVPGMTDVGAHARQFEWIAAFTYRGPGWYKENAQPQTAQTLFLSPIKEKEAAGPSFFGAFNPHWRHEFFSLNPDAVIVSGYGWRTHRDIIAECARRRIPVAMWSDSNLRSQRGRGFKARLKRRLKKAWLAPLLRRTALQLTANRLGLAYWRYFGVPRDRILLCPCYSDYARVEAARAGRGVEQTGNPQNQPAARTATLARIGLAPADRFLFTAARLVPAKGLDLMTRAFLQSPLPARGCKWVIAGVGPLEADLKALAGPALNTSIFFVGFQQPSDNLALMAHADFFVLPSRYEPHGIVVPESLAAGTPVLASTVVGAAPDLVHPGRSGLLFRSEDADHLARQLAWIADHPAETAAMRATARAAFEDWYRRSSPILVVPRAVQRMLASAGKPPTASAPPRGATP